MSELRVAEIHNPNDQTGGITIDNNDNVSINGSPIGNQGALGNRNLIINGAMQIAQRGDDVDDVTTSDYRTCDRFRVNIGSLGTWTVQQASKADDADNAPDGFSESLRVLCTTANASPAASAFCLINYFVEASDCQRLFDTGTTTHPMRLSFWVKSNRTGDASVSLLQEDNSNRMFSTSYNIASANTWQRVVIPIPVDTAAAFANDNGVGLQIDWWLNSGSDFTGGTHSAGWVALDQTARNADNLGVGGTVNDDFFLTGVQLEVGTNATAFEHRPIGTELALCQRYFFRAPDAFVNFSGDVEGVGSYMATASLPVSMRITPNIPVASITRSTSTTDNFPTLTFSNASTDHVALAANSTGLRAACFFIGGCDCDAEL